MFRSCHRVVECMIPELNAFIRTMWRINETECALGSFTIVGGIDQRSCVKRVRSQCDRIYLHNNKPVAMPAYIASNDCSVAFLQACRRRRFQNVHLLSGTNHPPELKTERYLGAGDSSEFLTNAEIWAIVDPRKRSLPYVYEKFETWGTCSEWHFDV